jgi:hypothetical protein
MSANRTHGAPLAHPSCAPPAPASSNLTLGTPDANGAGANSVGTFALATRTGDVAIGVSVTDVRCAAGVATCSAANGADGPDYVGELKATYDLRLTDTFNGDDGTTAATVADTSFPVTVPCAETADATVGATCALAATANAVVPGSVRSGDRAIWQVGEMQVLDGGADGVAATSPNSLFATQGVFVP